MPIKSVCLNLNFEELALNHARESHASETYALELCAKELAHLSVFLAVPVFKFPAMMPGAGFFPGANAQADEINKNRHARAKQAQERIASAAKAAGVSAEFHANLDSASRLREMLVASAGPSDLIILSRSEYYLSLDRNMIEAMLFTSGRPVIVVPPEWERGAQFEKILVAWDGSGRAARAVGDAIPLLARAGEVEIVTVSQGGAKNASSAGLAAHLARHCRKVVAADLPVRHGGIAKTLRDHAAAAGAGLLVMGAYAHQRMLEIALGGVTADMLSEGELPVFLSH